MLNRQTLLGTKIRWGAIYKRARKKTSRRNKCTFGDLFRKKAQKFLKISKFLEILKTFQNLSIKSIFGKICHHKILQIKRHRFNTDSSLHNKNGPLPHTCQIWCIFVTYICVFVKNLHNLLLNIYFILLFCDYTLLNT